jgi:hypothetical protein
MLATAVAGLPPDAAEFVAEVKWDGLRACALLESVEQPVSPFTGLLPPAITRQARWARPVIAAEVSYLERTPPDGSAVRRGAA